MQLNGKTAIVTGGTDGIGREIAVAMRSRGAQVIVVGRNPDRLEASRAAGFETIAADLSTIGGCDAVVAAIADRPIDILVNNAGMGSNFDINQPIDMGVVDQAIFLNLNAPIRLIEALLPGMRARPAAMIVNVTSGLAIAPAAKSPVYCATKAGLKSFTQALRAQLAGSSVHVLEALPPVVETRMTAENLHKKMPAAECARQIIVAMEQNRAEANVGMTSLLATVHNLAPWLARRIMLRY